MTELLYLYGFVPEGSPSPPEELTGVEERPVETIPLDGFRAAVSSLPEDAYREPELQERLKDLAWVARRGVLHEKVVTWFVDREGIVPARLLTLYSSREALGEEAGSRKRRIRELLDRFGRLREWNLKVTFDPEEMAPRLGEESAGIQRLDDEIARAGPGRKYLLERKRSDLAREEAARVAERLARDALEGLSGTVNEVSLIEVPREAREVRVALNAALLVDRGREDALRARVDERAGPLRERGLAVDFSGPWAPYRFIAAEDEQGKVEP